MNKNIYNYFNWLSIDFFYNKFTINDGSQVWHEIESIRSKPIYEMPKLPKFSNSEDKESIENIKSELSKIMKE